jgi:hypothetical protein
VISMDLGGMKVIATEYRGHTPEELAELAIDQIIYVGEKSHPLIIEQAKAFKEQIRQILIYYFAIAQKEERATVRGQLIKNDMPEISQIIDSL